MTNLRANYFSILKNIKILNFFCTSCVSIYVKKIRLDHFYIFIVFFSLQTNMIVRGENAILPYDDLYKMTVQFSGNNEFNTLEKFRLSSTSNIDISKIKLLLKTSGNEMDLFIKDNMVYIPMHKKLLGSNSMIISNQPKGSLSIFHGIDSAYSMNIAEGEMRYREFAKRAHEKYEVIASYIKENNFNVDLNSLVINFVIIFKSKANYKIVIDIRNEVNEFHDDSN